MLYQKPPPQKTKQKNKQKTHTQTKQQTNKQKTKTTTTKQQTATTQILSDLVYTKIYEDCAIEGTSLPVPVKKLFVFVWIIFVNIYNNSDIIFFLAILSWSAS